MGGEYKAALWMAIILGVVVLGACRSNAPDHEPFVIAWNYDTSGQLEPCGCSSNQLGGLARRATIIEEWRESQPVLAIEGG